MKKTRHIILGVHVKERTKSVPKLQKIFSKYGHLIKTRLGLHDVSCDNAVPTGLILLDLVACADGVAKFEKDLRSIKNVEVKKMMFVD